MRFSPGQAHDLLCPEPGSTTGRAIASLTLRVLNEQLASFELASIEDMAAREAFGVFVAAMDALLPGDPKTRVSVLASPMVRGPLEHALSSRAGEACIVAARAGLSVLERREFMPPSLFEEGPFYVVDPAALELSCGEVSLENGARERLAAAHRLLLTAASTELDELPRFFPVTLLGGDELTVRPAMLGLPRDEAPLGLAIATVAALARVKLAAYGALLEEDVSGISDAAEALVRRAFLRRLAGRRHPIAATEAFSSKLERAEAAVSGLVFEAPRADSLEGVASELSRLFAAGGS